MAKDDSKQQSTPKARVFKASEVHRRPSVRKERTARKASVKAADKSASVDKHPIAEGSAAVAAESDASRTGAHDVVESVAGNAAGNVADGVVELLEDGSAGRRSGSETSETDTPVDEKPEGPSDGGSEGASSAEAEHSQGADSAEPANVEREVASGSRQAEPSSVESKTASGAESEDAQDSEAAASSSAEPEHSQGADSAEPSDAEVEEASAAKAKKPKRKLSPRKVAFAVIVVILVVAAALAGLFSWNRWGRYDDHADMQGQWYVNGTAVPIQIDETSIHLADDVVYAYQIDDHDKTISYTFGDWEGQGRYWFNGDRSALVFTDGDDFTGSGNALDDLTQTVDDLASGIKGETPELPEGENVIALSRTDDPEALRIKEEKERAAAKQAEEAAEAEAEGDLDYFE